MRRGHEERGGSSGGDGSGGGAGAAAKTKQLGADDRKAAEKLEAARREATLRPRSWWDLGFSWGPVEPLQWTTMRSMTKTQRRNWFKKAKGKWR